MEEYLKNEFTVKETIRINKLRESLQKDAENDNWFEIGGDSAKLLLKYITKIEESLFFKEDE